MGFLRKGSLARHSTAAALHRQRLLPRLAAGRGDNIIIRDNTDVGPHQTLEKGNGNELADRSTSFAHLLPFLYYYSLFKKKKRTSGKKRSSPCINKQRPLL